MTLNYNLFRLSNIMPQTYFNALVVEVYLNYDGHEISAVAKKMNGDHGQKYRRAL